MFRKITMAALASAAFNLMFCGNEFSTSHANAKGGRGPGGHSGGHSVYHHGHRRGGVGEAAALSIAAGTFVRECRTSTRTMDT